MSRTENEIWLDIRVFWDTERRPQISAVDGRTRQYLSLAQLSEIAARNVDVRNLAEFGSIVAVEIGGMFRTGVTFAYPNAG